MDGPPLSELPPAGLLRHPGLREAEDHGGELRLQRDPEGETMLLVQDQHSAPGRWRLLASRCSTLVSRDATCRPCLLSEKRTDAGLSIHLLKSVSTWVLNAVSVVFFLAAHQRALHETGRGGDSPEG